MLFRPCLLGLWCLCLYYCVFWEVLLSFLSRFGNRNPESTDIVGVVRVNRAVLMTAVYDPSLPMSRGRWQEHQSERKLASEYIIRF